VYYNKQTRYENKRFPYNNSYIGFYLSKMASPCWGPSHMSVKLQEY